ncbi:MAG: hypothetical protein IKI20_08710 [Lachnospiraceae bacterium]|nr:hypothetical protein [Lachnospiraceae bacterium]
MDNFVDKLSQKINAQEMIKANAQAEANEMQRLQEQVAQYEAILQDMRKLNYKNSELTDKINALVDESMQKVHSSNQTGDGAESAAISADLSEAIMVAVDEALRGMDVGSSLNESVSNTLMIPVDQMKQSSLMVSDSVSEVRQIAEDVRTSVDDVRNSSEELKTSVKATMDNAILTMRRENREIADHLEYIRSTVDNIKNPGEDEELKAEEEAKRLAAEKEKEEARLAKEEEDRKALEEMFKQSDEFVHKENVKVYRNVQAVVVDEFKNQTDGLTKHNRELYEKVKSIRVAVIIAIALGAANIILTVLKILQIL